MRRPLTIALLLIALGTAACGEDVPVRDITPDPTAPTTAVATTIALGGETTAPTGEAIGPDSIDPAAIAPANLPDVTDPVLAAYQPALDGLDSILGAEGTANTLARLQAVTQAQAWNTEMLAALFASFCNDWDSDDSAGEGVGPLTEKGRSDWAAAITGPLYISPIDARLAAEWALADVDFSPPCQ